MSDERSRAKDLAEKLSFQGSEVFLDGERILKVPGDCETRTQIRMLGVCDHKIGDWDVFVGTGSCCHGHVLALDGTRLDQILTPDLCVEDMLPMAVDHKKTGFSTSGALLVTGQGCAGGGVRLMSVYYPQVIDIMPTEEFRGMYDGRRDGWVIPRLRADPETGRITLDLHRGGYRLRPGMSRDPTLPSILLDSKAEEFHVSDDLHSTLDLTERLARTGVDVEKSIDLSKDYHRIRQR